MPAPDRTGNGDPGRLWGRDTDKPVGEVTVVTAKSRAYVPVLTATSSPWSWSWASDDDVGALGSVPDFSKGERGWPPHLAKFPAGAPEATRRRRFRARS